MKRLALDPGTKRIGVAASDETSSMAFARHVIERKGWRRDLEALRRVVADEQPDEVVVGLPLRLDGSEGDRAADARRFAARLADALELPVVLCDERFSTVDAAAEMREIGVDARAGRSRVDAEAARHILQRYLDSLPVAESVEPC